MYKVTSKGHDLPLHEKQLENITECVIQHFLTLGDIQSITVRQ